MSLSHDRQTHQQTPALYKFAITQIKFLNLELNENRWRESFDLR